MNVKDEIEHYKLLADNLRKYTEELLNKGTASDIALQKDALHDRAEEVFKCDVIQRAVKDLGSAEIKFHNFVIPGGNMIGHIAMTASELGKWYLVTSKYNGYAAINFRYDSFTLICRIRHACATTLTTVE